MKPRFILPPHPSSSMRIRREDLPYYESLNRFVAQRKFNGTHVVIWVCDGEVVLWDRTGVALTLYRLTPGMKACLSKLTKDTELVMAGELLHTKAKSKITKSQEASDTIVLFDILMYNGKYCTGMKQNERLDLLAAVCGNPTRLETPKFPGATRRAIVVDEQDTAHLWLAEVFANEFQYHFDECCTDQLDKHGNDKYSEIEGLVLRDKIASLTIKGRGIGDVDWLIRCRKPKAKVYQF